MTRFLGAAAVLAAALGLGCNSSQGGAAAPTAPTSTPSTTTSGGGNPPTTQSCLPAAPENFRVTVSNTSTRVFTWNAVSNVQDYFIQIARVGSEDYLINTNTSQTTYTWAGTPPGNFWARVYARNSCGSGANSQQVFFN